MSKHTMQGRIEYNDQDDRVAFDVVVTFDTDTQSVDVVDTYSGDLNPHWFEGRFPTLCLGESVESDGSNSALTPHQLIDLIDEIRTSTREAGWKIL